MLKFDVVVTDWIVDSDGRNKCREVRRLEGVSAAKARRVITRAQRRGVRLYGGAMKTFNWGSIGGRPYRGSYRNATIYSAGFAR